MWHKEKLKTYFSWEIDSEGKFQLNDPETVMFANMSSDLLHILGCKKEPSTWKQPPLTHDMPSYFPIDIHHWHQIFVYVDFIDQQFVGNTRAPLLNTFPLFIPQQTPPKEADDKPGGNFGHGASCFRAFPNLTFKNVSKSTLIDLLVELRTDTGDLVPFVGIGRTNLTLMFRKKL